MKPHLPQANWRDIVLSHFTPEIASVARLSVVCDPDHLLAEQGVIEGIRARGFETIVFEDHVAFRLAYESRFRSAWDRGEATGLVVALRTASVRPTDLPFDLLDQARRESRFIPLSVGSVFPNLDPQIVARLERHHWESLHQASRDHVRERLGENATKDFVLRHVFDFDPGQLKSDADLLHLLLHRHYRAQGFPAFLDQRIIQLLRQQPRWHEWPLEVIVPSRSAFFGFLQERWPLFLERRMAATGNRVADASQPYSLNYPGPADLPFDHDKVHVYIDDLFVEGLLTPAKMAGNPVAPEPWMAVGIAREPGEDDAARLRKLLQILGDSVPGPSASHVEWIQAALRWAEATALRWAIPPDQNADIAEQFGTMRSVVDDAFRRWLGDHYGSLYSLGYLPRPVMVHHVPHLMAHGFGSPAETGGPAKRALVLLDGLALDQWVVLRRSILTDPQMSVEESATFAWIPTLTCVSRQAVFSGQVPFFFGPTIDQTQKDEVHWSRFWEDGGTRRSEVCFLLQRDQETDEAFLGRISEAAQHPRHRILGLVVGTVDRMVHGAATGSAGLHASIRHWAEEGHLHHLMTALLDNGFDVFLTSDHGNVEASGSGKPNVGVVASERGERVHVFRDELTRANVAKDFPASGSWPPIGLPDNYHPLLSLGRSAFIADGKRTVAHGGASLEEVMVPFAIIRRRA